MTDDDITRLREAAQAATPGPWKHIQAVGVYENYVYAPNARYGVSWAGDSPVKVAYLPPDPSGIRDAHDASYISAASPDATLALLDRLEQAERERDALLADARRYRWLRKHALMSYPSGEGSSQRDAYLTITGYGDAHDPGVIDAAIDALAAEEQSNG